MAYTILLCGAKKAASWGAADLSIVQAFMLFATTNIEKKLLFLLNIAAGAHTRPQQERVPEGSFCLICE